jgi:hypothetical protein
MAQYTSLMLGIQHHKVITLEVIFMYCRTIQDSLQNQ